MKHDEHGHGGHESTWTACGPSKTVAIPLVKHSPTQAIPPNPGHIGRSTDPAWAAEVSRNHGEVVCSPDGKIWFRDVSTGGTYILPGGHQLPFGEWHDVTGHDLCLGLFEPAPGRLLQFKWGTAGVEPARMAAVEPPHLPAPPTPLRPPPGPPEPHHPSHGHHAPAQHRHGPPPVPVPEPPASAAPEPVHVEPPPKPPRMPPPMQAPPMEEVQVSLLHAPRPGMRIGKIHDPKPAKVEVLSIESTQVVDRSEIEAAQVPDFEPVPERLADMADNISSGYKITIDHKAVTLPLNGRAVPFGSDPHLADQGGLAVHSSGVSRIHGFFRFNPFGGLPRPDGSPTGCIEVYDGNGQGRPSTNHVYRLSPGQQVGDAIVPGQFHPISLEDVVTFTDRTVFIAVDGAHPMYSTL